MNRQLAMKPISSKYMLWARRVFILFIIVTIALFADKLFHYFYPSKPRIEYKWPISCITSISFSPDGLLVAASDSSGSVSIWNVENGYQVLAINSQGGDNPALARPVVFLPTKGNKCLVLSSTNLVELWDAEKRSREVMPLRPDKRITSLAINPDGVRIAVGLEGGLVDVWRMDTNTISARFTMWGVEIDDIFFSPDGQMLAAADSHGGLKCWNVMTESEVLSDRPNSNYSPCLCLIFDNRSEYLILGNYHMEAGLFTSWNKIGEVRIWHLSSKRRRKTLLAKLRDAQAVTVSPDGLYLATGSSKGRVSILDLSTGKEIRTIETVNKYCVTALQFSPDGRYLAIAGCHGNNIAEFALWKAVNDRY